MKRICVEHHRRPGKSFLLNQALMLQLINELINQSSPEAAGIDISHWQAIRAAAEKISDMTLPEVSIRDMAVESRLSESHFRRLFKAVHRQSPRGMRQRTKIRTACERLIYTDMTLAEIADSLGYNNVHNFSRAFKIIMGLAPGMYRKHTP